MDEKVEDNVYSLHKIRYNGHIKKLVYTVFDQLLIGNQAQRCFCWQIAVILKTGAAIFVIP